jgi:hypothetical protein
VPAGPNFFRFADEAEFSGLLEEAGLVDVRVRTVEFALQLEDGDELWDGLIEGSVRVGPMILGQTDEVQRRIRELYDELLEAHRVDRGYDVPVSVKLASGRRPV